MIGGKLRGDGRAGFGLTMESRSGARFFGDVRWKRKLSGAIIDSCSGIKSAENSGFLPVSPSCFAEGKKNATKGFDTPLPQAYNPPRSTGLGPLAGQTGKGKRHCVACSLTLLILNGRDARSAVLLGGFHLIGPMFCASWLTRLCVECRSLFFGLPGFGFCWDLVD